MLTTTFRQTREIIGERPARSQRELATLGELVRHDLSCPGNFAKNKGDGDDHHRRMFGTGRRRVGRDPNDISLLCVQSPVGGFVNVNFGWSLGRPSSLLSPTCRFRCADARRAARVTRRPGGSRALWRALSYPRRRVPDLCPH